MYQCLRQVKAPEEERLDPASILSQNTAPGFQAIRAVAKLPPLESASQAAVGQHRWSWLRGRGAGADGALAITVEVEGQRLRHCSSARVVGPGGIFCPAAFLPQADDEEVMGETSRSLHLMARIRASVVQRLPVWLRCVSATLVQY